MTAPWPSGNRGFGATSARRAVGSLFKSKENSKMSNAKPGKPNQKFTRQRDVKQPINPAIDATAGPAKADGSAKANSSTDGYTKKSFADTKSFVEKLSGARSLDKMIEIQTEFAKTAYETFLAESQKIGVLYGDLAKQSYKPFSGIVAT
jgi:hypothetical protein